MKILVTGATGVYGRSLVERLHRAGHDVVAMARRPPRALPPGVRFAPADVRDLAAVEAAMGGCEVVAHLAFVVAPLKDRDASRAISVGGTANIVEAMRRTGARRLVFASSAMTYGANPDNPPLFTEDDPQRPSPDYIYGTDKVAAERVILDSGVDAVLARTAPTVARNIDDHLLIDIFAAPAIVGIKGVDIRYQLIHQDDIGRFFALACEGGPAGPVNVAPPDFIELRRMAEILDKPYLEMSPRAAMRAIEFGWKHDLVDITPAEAAGISYIPRMATDRLRNEWGFDCAWSTADAVIDLRRAVCGLSAVGKRRIKLPWRLRYPAQRPGDAVLDGSQARPAQPEVPGDLDTPLALSYPTYTAAVDAPGPLPALTLSTHLAALRGAVAGLLDAFGVPGAEQERLAAAGAAAVGHRLYVNDHIRLAIEATGLSRRRVLGRAYGAEVRRLSTWALDTLARADGLAGASDCRLDATLGALRDDLAWFWAIAAVGAVLDGAALGGFDELVTVLPGGASLAAMNGTRARILSSGAQAGARAQAERVAAALGQALAAAVDERVFRLVAAGCLDGADDAAHLTWDELVVAPPDLAKIVERRRAEHHRLLRFTIPATISATGPGSAVALAAVTP